MTRDSRNIATIYTCLFIMAIVTFFVFDNLFAWIIYIPCVVIGSFSVHYIFFRRCKLCGELKFLPDMMTKILPPDSACVHCHGDDNTYSE